MDNYYGASILRGEVMSIKSSIYKCDQCGKETETLLPDAPYSPLGWTYLYIRGHRELVGFKYGKHFEKEVNLCSDDCIFAFIKD